MSSMQDDNLASPAYSQSLAKGRLIRLVELHPGSWHDEILCTLSTESLDGVQSYEALSYVWGSSVNPGKILLGFANWFVRHTITRNLHTALRRLRELERPRILWVDALCINQEDDEERAHQVTMMDQVYARAQQGIIDLGEVEHIAFSPRVRDTSRQVAFSFNASDKSLLDQFQTQNPDVNTEAQHVPNRKSYGTEAFEVFCLIRLLAERCDLSGIKPFSNAFPEEDSGKYQRRLFERLRQLLRSKWWTRIWVVQEAIVSRGISVMYGRCSAPWSMFVAAASQCVQLNDSLRLRSFPQEHCKVLAHFSRLVLDLHELREERRKGSRTDIVSLLGQFSSRAASDDRDRVFALLGLANDGFLITPDYSLSVAETFQNVTLRMIDSSLSLDVMIGNIGTKNRMDLPSWTPDWSSSYDASNSSWSKSSRLYNSSAGLYAVLQNATKKHPSVPTEKAYQKWLELIGSGCKFAPIQSGHHHTLKMPAHQIGVISWVGEPCFSAEHMRSVIMSWQSMVDKILSLWNHPLAMNEFARTICADIFHANSGTEKRTPRRASQTDLQQVSVWLQEGKPDPEVLAAIHHALNRRRFFITRQGTMGLGPLETCLDDIVFLLPGGRTPFILRKEKVERLQESGRVILSEQGAHHGADIQLEAFYNVFIDRKSYTMVGGCYANAYMDGMAIDDWRKESSFPSKPLDLPPLSTWQSLGTTLLDDNPSFTQYAELRNYEEGLGATKWRIQGPAADERLIWQLPTPVAMGHENGDDPAMLRLRTILANHQNIFLYEDMHTALASSEDWQRREEIANQRDGRLGQTERLQPISTAFFKVKHYHSLDYDWAKRWGGKAWADRDDSLDIYIM